MVGWLGEGVWRRQRENTSARRQNKGKAPKRPKGAGGALPERKARRRRRPPRSVRPAKKPPRASWRGWLGLLSCSLPARPRRPSSRPAEGGARRQVRRARRDLGRARERIGAGTWRGETRRGGCFALSFSLFRERERERERAPPCGPRHCARTRARRGPDAAPALKHCLGPPARARASRARRAVNGSALAKRGFAKEHAGSFVC